MVSVPLWNSGEHLPHAPAGHLHMPEGGWRVAHGAGATRSSSQTKRLPVDGAYSHSRGDARDLVQFQTLGLVPVSTDGLLCPMQPALAAHNTHIHPLPHPQPSLLSNPPSLAGREDR